MSDSRIEGLIEDARRGQWCTKRYCSTCDRTEWRTGLESVADTPRGLADDLEQLPLAAWYDLPDFGAAIYHCFAVLHDRELVDEVLRDWLTRLDGHYRIADAVTFYVIREGRTSNEVRDEWLRRSEAMAVESGDPSLLETLVYAFGTRLREHPALVRVAEAARRGHAPLDRALKRTTETAASGM